MASFWLSCKGKDLLGAWGRTSLLGMPPKCQTRKQVLPAEHFCGVNVLGTVCCWGDCFAQNPTAHQRLELGLERKPL